MMAYMSSENVDIDRMPRGGPDASWLDRRLETGCQEYLDRDDVDDRIKRQVIASLDFVGRLFGNHQRFAELALDQVADVPDPKILELGAGHGGLSRELLSMHPTAEVTVTDVDAKSLTDIAAGDLGSHPRAAVREMDATAIEAADGYYDLAVFALSFHHLPPAPAAKVIAEGTRAANKLMIIDLPRPPSPLHLLRLALLLPLVGVAPLMHDGFISSLRAYSPSALRALAAHAGQDISVEFPTARGPQVVVASRTTARPDADASRLPAASTRR